MPDPLRVALVIGCAMGAAAAAGCGQANSSGGSPASSPGGACQGSSGVASATTAGYVVVLDVGPQEQMYSQQQVADSHPSSGEVMLGGSMTGVSGRDVRHLEAHICTRSSGAVVTGAQPAIAVLDDTAGTSAQNIPVAQMQGVASGPSDYHYGNNVLLKPGHAYTVTVRLNGEAATLHFKAS